MRADALLVHRGLVASRTLARRLIEAGAVCARVAGVSAPVARASADLPEDAELEIAQAPESRYVSRGGLKLEGALLRAAIDPAGLVCLDIGQSTGGFTDCLLRHGASRVVGIDVGHGQLDARLRGDPRVRAFERVNVRELAPAGLGDAMPPEGFGLVAIDVSFISLERVLPVAAALAAPGATLLALVKPQFEAGPGGVGKGGIVKSPAVHAEVRARIVAAARSAGWTVRDWFDSPIAGGDGNREFFLYATR